MRVIVAGGLKQPTLLNTNQATSLLITKEDGEPVVLFRFLPDDKGFIRLTKGEDKTFDEDLRLAGLKT